MQVRTPNANSIEFNCGGFETLTEALDYAAKGVTGLNFYSVRGELQNVLTYAELQSRAMTMAARLTTETEPGELIGLIAETSPDFAVMFFACQYAGVLPVPISVPVTLGSNEFYKDQLKRICETANLHCLLAPNSILSLAHDALAPTQIQVGNLDGSDLPHAVSELRAFTPEDMCYIQFSSGSTSSPKGIVGSQKSVTTNCRAIQLGLEAGAGDRISSWLPLYHDMGLVGQFLAPMMAQLSVDYIDSHSFARRPSTWLKLISENKATHSYSPSFGYEISAKRWRGGDLDLSSWRVAGIGGDIRIVGLYVCCGAFGSGQDPAPFSVSGIEPNDFRYTLLYIPAACRMKPILLVKRSNGTLPAQKRRPGGDAPSWRYLVNEG